MTRVRRARAATACAILCLVLISSFVSPVEARASDSSRLEETRRQLRATRSRISELRQMDSQLVAVISETATS